MIRPWTGIAAVALVAAVMGPAPARADGKNEIRAVAFDEDSGTTRIHVRGAQTPTFTVYKLEKPTRVVVDVPQARLAEALRGHESSLVTTASTWAVSTIATQQIDDGGTFVRVIISLARPGRYDVKTDGNALVVVVTARDPAPVHASPEALAKAQAESAKAQAERAKAQAESAKAQAESEQARKATAAARAQVQEAQA